MTKMNVNVNGVRIGADDSTAGVGVSLDVTGKMKQDNIVARLTPAGSLVQFAGGSIPAGWLLAAGQAVSRTTYADLFAAIAVIYGAGDGATTFNLPNMQGRVPVGVDTADAAFVGLNTKGGTQTHTLTTTQMPSHGHAIYASTGGGASPYRKCVTSLGDNYTGGLYTVRGTVAEMEQVGGGAAHNIMQPYISLYYIIAT